MSFTTRRKDIRFKANEVQIMFKVLKLGFLQLDSKKQYVNWFRENLKLPTFPHSLPANDTLDTTKWEMLQPRGVLSLGP